jgi:small conductance mechanosensitive channel
MENQYRVGDVVEISGQSGRVIKITNRITVLRDSSGSIHYIPNGTITTATNMTMEFGKVNMKLNLAYDSNIDQVKKVVDDVGKKLAKDKKWQDDILDPPHFARVSDFGEYALVVTVVGKVKPAKQWSVEGELRQRLKVAFDKSGIVIQVSPLSANTKSAAKL